MKKILVIGSTCLDMIINIEHLPDRCEDINSKSVNFTLGGMAYNVYNILNLLNVPSILGSGIGEGRFANIVNEILEVKGYRPIGKILNKDNGVCICLVDKTKDRSFISQHGAEYLFDPDWFKDINLKEIKLVYISGLEIEDKDGIKIIEFLEKNNLIVFFAPGPRIKYIPIELLNRIYKLRPIIHLNEEEILTISNSNNLNEALKLLHNKTNNIIIVTLGEKGSILYDGNKIYEASSKKDIEVVDTIGAGDNHAGACLAGLYYNLEYENILKIANQIGANIVGHLGASANIKDVEGIKLK